MKLEGKVAIVTGAGSGIGQGDRARLRREGAQVVVADLNARRGQSVADEISGNGGEALAIRRRRARLKTRRRPWSTRAVERFGGLDILVNNAGVGRIIPFLETTSADWDLMFDVNCKGLLWCSQAAARQMIAQGRGGKIVNLASQAGRRGEALVLAYCASKACVISMTQSMALALAEHKINVNAIAPGIVDTPFWVEVDKQFASIAGLGNRRAETTLRRINSVGPDRATRRRRQRCRLPRFLRFRLHDPADHQR